MTSLANVLSGPPTEAPYAHLYGTRLLGTGLYGGLPFVSAVLRDRLLRFVRMGPNMRGVVGVGADRAGTFIHRCQEIIDGFDLDTATGDRLDKLGGILQRPRNGASDTKYRALLDIQVRLLLSSNGSAPLLLEVIELFSGVAATEYRENYPRSISIGARLNTLVERDELLDLIRQARSAGTAYSLSVELSDDVLVNDIISSPISGAGSTDFVSGPAVADAYETSIVKAGT